MNGWAEIVAAILTGAGIISGALKWIQHGLRASIADHAEALRENTQALAENTSERKKSGAVTAARALLLLVLLLPLAGCAQTDPLIVRALERNREVWEEDRRPDLAPELVTSREAEFDAQLRYAKAPK